MSSKAHLIIGAGQAGAHAAIAMREAGFAGRVVLLGSEPHWPYNRPPLSKAYLTRPEPPGLEYFFARERYAGAAIEVRLGNGVQAIDPKAGQVFLADGGIESFDRLIIATGSRARELSIPGADRALTLRTPEDASRLRERFASGTRVVCIGAGVIGLEVASSARTLGCSVTVVEAGPAAMMRSLSPDVGSIVENLHRDAGVDLLFNVRPERIEEGKVYCSNGEVLDADVIVAGVGIERNTELAEAAGLAVSSGILTDETGLTSAAGIYAAGEVAATYDARTDNHVRLESWRHAQQHGIAVGRSVAGTPTPYEDVPWFWTDQQGANIQVAGARDGSVSTVLRGTPGGASVSAFYLTDKNLITGVVGINANRDVAAGIRLIRSGRAVDPSVLANQSVTAQKLVTEAFA